MNDKTMGLMLGAIGVAAFNLGFSAGKYPDDYIPVWTSQDGGDISMMMNTDEIARIIPVAPDVMSREDEGYVEVHFSDGKMYKVYEDFDEFMSRVRSSRR
jgi:hypothetical protein